MTAPPTNTVEAVMPLSGALVGGLAGGECFGEQLAEHVGSAALLGFGERVDLGERVGVESDGDLGAGVTSWHAGSVSHLTTCDAMGYSFGMTQIADPATDIATLAEIIRPYLPAAIERFGSLEDAVDALVTLMAQDEAA